MSLQEIAQQAAKQTQDDAELTAFIIDFFNNPNHKDAAGIVKVIQKNQLRYSNGKWYVKTGPVWYEQESILTLCSNSISSLITLEFESRRTLMQETIKSLTDKLRKALKECQTTYFLNGVIAQLKELLGQEIEWNKTECAMPFLDGIIDFSGTIPIKREPMEGEFFRDPIAYACAEILNAGEPENFNRILSEIYKDQGTRKTFRLSIASGIANRGIKNFMVLYDPYGNGAKGFLIVFYAYEVYKNYGVLLSPNLILKKADQSSARFAAIELDGMLIGFYEEVVDQIDTAQIKHQTGAGMIRGEAKGQTPKTFQQRATLFLLTNQLPNFTPATDSAFINRLVVIPSSTNFYASEAHREELLQRGADPENLKPQVDKDILLEQIRPEIPGILKMAMQDAIELRDVYGYAIPESAECVKAKIAYKTENDLVGQFFNSELQADPKGEIENSKLLNLWIDWSGESKANIRGVKSKLKKRFPFIGDKKSGPIRYTTGIIERPAYADENVQSFNLGTLGRKTIEIYSENGFDTTYSNQVEKSSLLSERPKTELKQDSNPDHDNPWGGIF